MKKNSKNNKISVLEKQGKTIITIFALSKQKNFNKGG